VYSASFDYKPLDVTAFSVMASRGVSASYFANRVSKNSSVSANLTQRLLEKFYLSVGVSRGKNDYLSPELSFASTRGDRYDSFNATLSTRFLTRGSASITYQVGRNTSDVANFTFKTRQIGMELTYHY
jgi:hypothetical protein